MIKISIKEKDNNIEIISITGHAMYSDYGKDIVCSSVSSIVITTVNAIDRLDKPSIIYTVEPFSIKVVKNSHITNQLLINMISLLKELEIEYPKNIKFL